LVSLLHPEMPGRILVARDGWATLAPVIDCHTRELLGWEPDFYNYLEMFQLLRPVRGI
jgi:hypothetical protein